MTTSRILILYAHPAQERSRANRAMIEAARTLPNVRIHDLYECYPDFHIDVEYEQTQLHEADLIVFHHPIHWYSLGKLNNQHVNHRAQFIVFVAGSGQILRALLCRQVNGRLKNVFDLLPTFRSHYFLYSIQ